MKITTLVVHHTVTSPTATRADILRMHKARGFRDVGYHHLIRQAVVERRWHDEPMQLIDGAELIVGRPMDTDSTLDPWEYGAHSRGENTTSVGVSLVGNYSETALPEAMLGMLVQYLADRCEWWDIDPWAGVKGHREMPGAATECPGLNVDMGAIRKLVAAELNARRTCP